MNNPHRKTILFNTFGIALLLVMHSNLAAAVAIYFDDIRPVAVTGEDLLGLLKPSSQIYSLNITGSLYSETASSSGSGAFGTAYTDVGYFDLQIKKSEMDYLSPSIQVMSVYGDRPPGDINVLNDCSYCPTASDLFTFSYAPPYTTANYFAVDWVVPPLMDYLAYEYLSSFDIVLTDYDGDIFSDESLPSLDAFESAYAFLGVSVSYPYSETKTARYILDLKSENVYEPSTIMLLIIGIFALQCARRRKKLNTTHPA